MEMPPDAQPPVKKNVPRSAAAVLPFFFLNHRLEPARLQARIREIHAAGGDGFFLHAREGLATPYLSEEWFAAVATCLDCARQLGLRAWLYDEMPYPSGAAGGEVVRRRPEFIEQSLHRQQRRAAGGRRLAWPLGDGVMLACYARRRTGRREILNLRDHVGPVADTWRRTDAIDSRLYYPTGPAEVFNCPRAICVLPENVLAVTLPAGAWDLVAVTVRAGGDLLEPFGQYVDVSNPKATALFLELTHEAYRRRFGRHLGRLVPGIFVDEPKFRNPLPWGQGVAARLGTVSASLAFALAGDQGAAADAERRRYRRVTAEAFRQNWTTPISRWCQRHRLALTGHISPEEEWWYESRHVGSILANLRRFHVPGCDVIIPAAGDRKNALLNLTAGLAVSAAAQGGRKQALCEVFGACDFTLDLRTMKRMGDWLAVSGINVAVPHGFLYSLDGYRKLDAPPSFAPPAFAAADMRAWSDAFRAAAAALGPGTAADVLIVRPIDGLRGLPDSERPRADRLLARAARLATDLARRGLRVHWIDDDELAGVKWSHGQFRFMAGRYRQLAYFPDFTPAPIRRQLRALASAGGAVLPERTAHRTLRGPLHTTGDIHAARRRDGLWFCANVGTRPAAFTLGQARGVLQGGESRIVDAAIAPAAAPRTRTVITLPDRWTVDWTGPNRAVLDRWTLNGRPVELTPAFDLRPGWSSASGQTLFGPVPLQPELPKPQSWIYRTQFTVKGRPKLELVCESGHLRGEWTARLNGRPLRQWRESGDFELRHTLAGLRAGVNRLEFHFTLRRSTDGLIGPCHLEGNCLVRPGPQLRPRPAGRITATARTTRSQLGLPHHGGGVRYRQSFQLAEVPAAGSAIPPYIMTCAGIAGTGATVRVNGAPCGAVRWAPDEVDVTSALRRGTNVVELELRGSPVVLTGRTDPTRLGCRVRLIAQTVGRGR